MLCFAIPVLHLKGQLNLFSIIIFFFFFLLNIGRSWSRSCPFFYGSGSSPKPVMRIRLNYYTDPDPRIRNPPYKSRSGSKEKTSQSSIFPNFVEKNVLNNIEQQLYIKFAKVPREQLRSQKRCKDP